MSAPSRKLVVREETTTTPASLYKIGFFAAFAFLGMAAMSQPEFRGVPLFVGGLIIATLLGVAGWMKFQNRYGQATLVATPLVFGERFEGFIETELERPPKDAVRVTIFGRHRSMNVYAFSVDDAVEPRRFARTPSHNLQIPFSVQLPGDDASRQSVGVRLVARTRWWPLGWGATFLLEPTGAEEWFL